MGNSQPFSSATAGQPAAVLPSQLLNQSQVSACSFSHQHDDFDLTLDTAWPRPLQSPYYGTCRVEPAGDDFQYKIFVATHEIGKRGKSTLKNVLQPSMMDGSPQDMRIRGEKRVWKERLLSIRSFYNYVGWSVGMRKADERSDDAVALPVDGHVSAPQLISVGDLPFKLQCKQADDGRGKASLQLAATKVISWQLKTGNFLECVCHSGKATEALFQTCMFAHKSFTRIAPILDDKSPQLMARQKRIPGFITIDLGMDSRIASLRPHTSAVDFSDDDVLDWRRRFIKLFQTQDTSKIIDVENMMLKNKNWQRLMEKMNYTYGPEPASGAEFSPTTFAGAWRLEMLGPDGPSLVFEGNHSHELVMPLDEDTLSYQRFSGHAKGGVRKESAPPMRLTSNSTIKLSFVLDEINCADEDEQAAPWIGYVHDTNGMMRTAVLSASKETQKMLSTQNGPQSHIALRRTLVDACRKLISFRELHRPPLDEDTGAMGNFIDVGWQPPHVAAQPANSKHIEREELRKDMRRIQQLSYQLKEAQAQAQKQAAPDRADEAAPTAAAQPAKPKDNDREELRKDMRRIQQLSFQLKAAQAQKQAAQDLVYHV